MKKILIIGTNLFSGGAERVLVELANQLSLAGSYKVSVLSLEANKEGHYSLEKNVRLYENEQKSKFNSFFSCLAIRRLVKVTNPCLIISFLHINNAITLFSVGNSVPVVITEHSHPHYDILAFPWNLLRFLTYWRAAALVSVSKGVSDTFWWVPGKKRHVIYNPVPAQSVPSIDESDRDKTIVGMGRLHKDKNFQDLILVFHRMRKKLADWKLIIIGEGDQRTELALMIDRLDLQGSVILTGRLEDPFSILKSAGLFVSTSLHEGFGNAIVEAMACGVPVISYDAPCGPGEIIEHNVNGVLVKNGDTESLESEIKRVLSDNTLRKNLAQQGLKRADDFSRKNIVKQWEGLIESLMVKTGEKQ